MTSVTQGDAQVQYLFMQHGFSGHSLHIRCYILEKLNIWLGRPDGSTYPKDQQGSQASGQRSREAERALG